MLQINIQKKNFQINLKIGGSPKIEPNLLKMLISEAKRTVNFRDENFIKSHDKGHFFICLTSGTNFLTNAPIIRLESFISHGFTKDEILNTFKQFEIVNINKSSAEYIKSGSSNSKIGKNKDAIDDFSKAIELDPQCIEAYNLRGIEYAKIDNIDKSLADFTLAIEINPQFDMAYYNRGKLYEIIGAHDNAISDFTKAIEIDPQYSDAYVNRGTVYGIIGLYEKEIADYTKAIECNPQEAYAFYNRGRVYKIIGLYDKASLDFHKAGQLFANQGNSALALKAYSKAV